MRTYSLNEIFFDVIDTEVKAYFLGLMYADGNLEKDRPRISIGLQEEDCYLLNGFKNSLQYNGPLIYKKRTNRPNNKRLWALQLNSQRLYEGLIRCGCTPNKSLTVRFPIETEVPTAILNHFIRGYFDGDGCIMYRVDGNRHRQNLTICVSHEFGKDMQRFLFSKLNIDLSLDIHPCSKISILRCSKSLDLYKFKDYIYSNATIFLRRKKQIFDSLKLFNTNNLQEKN